MTTLCVTDYPPPHTFSSCLQRKIRGGALVEEHSKSIAGQKDEDEDPSKAIWDHSRDMSLGGRLMDDGKRNKMIREAKGLGDRFGTGTSGGFL